VEIKVLEERKNPLLKRTELQFEVAHTGGATPRRSEVQGELAKQLKVPKERLVVESMHARFGIAQTRGEALVYATNEARDQVTREHILIRNGLKEKKSAAPPGTETTPAAPEPTAKPAAKPEPAPEVKAEKPAEPKAEAAPAPKAEKKAEKKGEKKTEAKAEGKPEAKAASKPAKEA
jgi:small subunit ribosomal protein S24e